MVRSRKSYSPRSGSTSWRKSSAKVLAQIRREGNVLSEILRESFDSGNLAVLTRKDPIQAFGAHICISGHITPEELLDRLNHIEMANGFGNRFLWFAVKSDKVMPRCRPIPPEVYDGMARHVKAVRASKETQVPLADASQREWEEVIYPSLREDRPGMAGALTARGSAFVLRLALIYSLFDPPQPGVSRVILPAHLHAAMAVWALLRGVGKDAVQDEGRARCWRTKYCGCWSPGRRPRTSLIITCHRSRKPTYPARLWTWKRPD